MSDSSQQFNPFAPGFDFLKKLTEAVGSPPHNTQPAWGDWVAPTMNVQELEKRIGELKTVLFWLEQNQRALAATIQAMEVQKMTLSALQTMNVPVENWASTLVQSWQNLAQNGMHGATSARGDVPSAASAAPCPAPEQQEPGQTAATQKDAHAAQNKAAASACATVAEPLQWWGALTQQFQQIANKAVADVSQQAMQHAQAKRQAAQPAARRKRTDSATPKKPSAQRSAPDKKATPSKRSTVSRAR